MAQNVPRKQPSPSVSDLSHMLSRGRTPHQIVQVTPHIKENAENTSTVTLLSANSRSQMLAVCMVYVSLFYKPGDTVHLKDRLRVLFDRVSPPGSVAVPWKPPDHVHASIWLEASSSLHPPALTWWHTAAQG